MKFSLIQIYQESDDYVDGVWIQDYTGSLDEAIQKARATEVANSNRIKIAVVDKLSGIHDYNLLKHLKRLA